MGESATRVWHRATWIDAVVGAALAILFVVARGGAAPTLVGAVYAVAVAGRLIRVDVREHRLPNALVLPGFAFAAIGLVVEAVARGSPALLLVASMLGAAVGACLLALASGGGLGMGDVKLATLLVVALAGACGESAERAVAAFLGAAFLAGGAAGAAALVRSGDAWRREEVAFGPILLAAFWTAGVLS